MRGLPTVPGAAYLAAVCFTALAVLLRWLLDPWLGDHLALATLFGAVAAAAWLGGYRPAVLAAALGYLACSWLFIPPRGALGVPEARHAIGLGLYALSSAIIIGFGEGMRSARQQARRNAERVEQTVESITDALVTVDRDWRCTTVNAEAERLLGRPRQQLVGRVVWEVFPEAVGTRFYQEMHQAARERREVRSEHYHAPFDRWFESHIYPTAEGVTVYASDVTERKRAEEAARSARELLRLITDNLPALIAYVDKEYRYRLNNRAYEVWFGRPRAEVTGREVREVLGDAAWERLRPYMEAAVSGRAVTYEGEAPYKDGGTRWIEASYVPHAGPGGAVEGLAVLVNDATERRRREEDLRLSEQRFRRLIDVSSQIVWVANAAGEPEEDSPSWRAFTGRAYEQWKGWAWLGAVHPDDRAGLEAAWRRGVEAVAPFRHEYRLLRADGVYRSVVCNTAPVLNADGAVREWVGMSTDVTDLRRAEEATALLAAVVRSSEDAIVTKTLDGVITSWNAGAERLFGHPAAEAVGRPITLIIPPGRLDEERDILRRIARGESVEHYETVRVARDGRLLDVSLTVSPVRDAAGRVVGASKVGRDITARKRAEAELRRLNAELSDAHRRKDEFLAPLAHELRNPLAPIRNAVEILRLTGPAEGGPDGVLDVIDRQLRQMTRLVDDLLDVSRISRGKVRLRRERVDLAAAVRDAVEGARPLMDAAGHRLEVALPAGPVTLDADPTRLTQVLLNLLNNAAKFTPAGGQVWLAAERRGTEAVVTVRDTGVGVAAEDLPRLFQMFSQVAPALERSQGGLGIGLALAKGLVELHGGTIEAKSDGPGRGSEFTVRLPLAGPAVEPAAAAGNGEVTGGSPRRRILLVEDNPDSARTMGMMLRLMGHEVHTAEDGAEGVRVAEAVRPEVVVLDIGLPKMNGYEAARHIRRQAWGRAMTLIALTGWGQEEDKRRAAEAGFDRHLTKPVDRANLEAALRG